MAELQREEHEAINLVNTAEAKATQAAAAANQQPAVCARRLIMATFKTASTRCSRTSSATRAYNWIRFSCRDVYSWVQLERDRAKSDAARRQMILEIMVAA